MQHNSELSQIENPAQLNVQLFNRAAPTKDVSPQHWSNQTSTFRVPAGTYDDDIPAKKGHTTVEEDAKEGDQTTDDEEVDCVFGRSELRPMQLDKKEERSEKKDTKQKKSTNPTCK